MYVYEVELKINGKSIDLSGFPRDFVTRTMAGAATALRGVDEVSSLDFKLKFGKVKLAVNGEAVKLIQFPTLILANTVVGMASALNGVDGEVKEVEISMKEIRP